MREDNHSSVSAGTGGLAVSQRKGTHAYVLWITISALFMALNIALSSFGLPVPGGHFYLCDIAIDTAALVLDPVAAFAVGGIGSFLGDLIFYPPSMLVSLVVHGLQAVVISLIAHHTFREHRLLGSTLAVLAGMVVMVVGYTLGKAFVYGTPEAALLKIPYEILQADVGAVGSLFLCFRCGVLRVEKQIYD